MLLEEDLLAEAAELCRGDLQHGRHPFGAEIDAALAHYKLRADQEWQARRLLEYCELEWDPVCLDFHKTKRQVRTASVRQVRQPIYKTSVERWRAYEKFLGPLLDELGDLVKR